MNIIKGLGWCVIFFLAIIIGDSPALLNIIPLPVLIILSIAPFIFILWMVIGRDGSRGLCIDGQGKEE